MRKRAYDYEKTGVPIMRKRAYDRKSFLCEPVAPPMSDAELSAAIQGEVNAITALEHALTKRREKVDGMQMEQLRRIMAVKRSTA